MTTKWEENDDWVTCVFATKPSIATIVGELSMEIETGRKEDIQQLIDCYLQMMETAIIIKLKREI